jgi:hypothetical protein
VNQASLDFSGKDLRDMGMAQAIGHAESVDPNWPESAHQALIRFIGSHRGEFMAEQVREFAAKTGLSQPPHLRAWGSVFLRAARAGLIRRVGFGQVTNPKAHCANAAVWRAVL